jgi:hypothetical protein
MPLRIVITLLACVMAVNSSAQQKTKLQRGFALGIGFSRVSEYIDVPAIFRMEFDDRVRISPTIGFILRSELGDGFAFCPQLFYSARGGKINAYDTSGIIGTLDIRSDYLELSTTINIMWTKRAYIELGPSILINVLDNCRVTSISPPTISIDTKRFDVGVVFGTGHIFDLSSYAILIGSRLSLGMRNTCEIKGIELVDPQVIKTSQILLYIGFFW